MKTKNGSKQAQKKTRADAIRVVPLYHPKRYVRLEELGKTKEDRDLLTGIGEPWAATPRLIYNGGALIQNVKVHTIFWGMNWKSDAGMSKLKDKVSQFFTDILISPLMDQLSEYNAGNWKIGHGSLAGTQVITNGAPTGSIQDSEIQSMLKTWINAGAVPPWDADTLYFIYMDKGVQVIMGGAGSCSSFCGYHDAIGDQEYYAVMPFPSCAGCLADLSIIDALTGTSSHELCEAITDPVPPSGWYDNNNGEIGDICAWKFKSVSGHNVQLEWSNRAGNCI